MTKSVPKFATSQDRAKVEQLMQPALIRVIDNIRKQLDDVAWEGHYEEELRWPTGTTPEQQQEYTDLQKMLHGVPPEEHDRVSALISELPQPSPLYTLRLQQANHTDQTVDIWALCYQICAAPGDADTMQADETLFDEQGEVDWRSLDDKTKAIIDSIFAKLPTLAPNT